MKFNYSFVRGEGEGGGVGGGYGNKKTGQLV